MLTGRKAAGFEADETRITRTFLKDDTADLLRDYIISGRVLPGAKLVERQLAEALGISRMPIRDALIKLEEKGLVVTRPAGRYVVEVSRDETRQLMQVRSALEALATEQAARRIGRQDRADMEAALARMGAACRVREPAGFIRADLEIHEAIWRASGNKYLQQTLSDILGPLLVVISSSAQTFDWSETLAIHEQLVAAVAARDVPAAAAVMSRHMLSVIDRI